MKHGILNNIVQTNVSALLNFHKDITVVTNSITVLRKREDTLVVHGLHLVLLNNDNCTTILHHKIT